MKQIVVLFAALALALAAPSTNSTKSEIVSFHTFIEGRIVGGDPIDIHLVPWQVALLRNGALICGGVLVDKRIVLTAAHCVAPSVISDISQLNIRAGSSLHNTGGIRVAAERTIIHPEYQDCWWCDIDYDIAIIFLAEDAISPDLSSYPIPLHGHDEEFTIGDMASVSGWGATSEGGFGSTQLRNVLLPIVGTPECRQVYGSIISERTVCAGFPEGGYDACQGDSGGPLVVDGKLAGLVSSGYGCARPAIPGVYSSIPGYRSWIRENAHI